MRRIIRIDPRAVSDLKGHQDYIAQDSREVAIRLELAAQATFQLIADMPGIGSPQSFAKSQLAGVRRWPIEGFENYLIYYRADDEAVEVIRVLHGARDIASIMEGEA